MRIGGRDAAAGRAYVIAEAGVNHDGDLVRAHALVDAAADSGADAVKFQTWITEAICAPGAHSAPYQSASGDDDQFAMLKRLELPFAWHAELRDHAVARGIDFLSTPDDAESARFLAGLGVPAMKVGSAELTNDVHLRVIASFGLPVILSTGMATLEQARHAVDVVRDAGAPDVGVLHCVSAYPAPADEMNLRAIATLGEALGVTTGLSDHSVGATAAIVAVGIGMAFLEKHITTDRSLPGPDHSASAEPGEFAEMVRAVRLAESMLGSGEKAMSRSERATHDAVRRVLVFAESLPAGTAIVAGHLMAVRTGRAGIGSEDRGSVLGRRLSRAVTANAPVTIDDLR